MKILLLVVTLFCVTACANEIGRALPETRTVTDITSIVPGSLFSQPVCIVDTNKGKVSMHTDSCVYVQIGDTIVYSEYGYGWVRT